MFEFKIYDLHYKVLFDDLGEMYKLPYDGIEWLTFDFSVNENSLKIEAFRSDVLFNDDTPINCTKVYLSDGSHVYAKNNYDTFKKNYYNYIIDKAKGILSSE